MVDVRVSPPEHHMKIRSNFSFLILEFVVFVVGVPLLPAVVVAVVSAVADDVLVVDVLVLVQEGVVVVLVRATLAVRVSALIGILIAVMLSCLCCNLTPGHPNILLIVKTVEKATFADLEPCTSEAKVPPSKEPLLWRRKGASQPNHHLWSHPVKVKAKLVNVEVKKIIDLNTINSAPSSLSLYSRRAA